MGDMEKKINNINPEKTTINDSNPPKIFKTYSKVPASVLIEKSEFPQNLKLTDITSVYKKNNLLNKANY